MVKSLVLYQAKFERHWTTFRAGSNIRWPWQKILINSLTFSAEILKKSLSKNDHDIFFLYQNEYSKYLQKQI